MTADRQPEIRRQSDVSFTVSRKDRSPLLPFGILARFDNSQNVKMTAQRLPYNAAFSHQKPDPVACLAPAVSSAAESP
jgi:hypothetical protein